MEMYRNQQKAYKRKTNKNQHNHTMEKLKYKKDFQVNKKSYTVIYENQEVGTYIDPKYHVPPHQLLSNLTNKKYNIKHLGVTIRKNTQLKNSISLKDIPIHADELNQESMHIPLI